VSIENVLSTKKWRGFDKIVAIHFLSTLFAAILWIAIRVSEPEPPELSKGYVSFARPAQMVQRLCCLPISK